MSLSTSDQCHLRIFFPYVYAPEKKKKNKYRDTVNIVNKDSLARVK
jgi:hypothetical protein